MRNDVIDSCLLSKLGHVSCVNFHTCFKASLATVSMMCSKEAIGVRDSKYTTKSSGFFNHRVFRNFSCSFLMANDRA